MSAFLRRQLARLGPALPLDQILRKAVRSGPDGDANFGYWINAPRSPLPARPLEEVAPHILDQQPKDTALWPYLFSIFPNWHWGMQPTGDCTRWMKQHELDALYASLAVCAKIKKPTRLVAGESLYALAKCELVNSYRYHGAGATGWALAQALRDYGHLWRRLYQTDAGEWDLRQETEYSIPWGDSGRGLPDSLEPYAAANRAGDLVEVRTPEEAGKLIQAGYPCDYCGYTYWAKKRGEDGIGTRFSSGWHAMTATGVRWDGNQVDALWIANTGHGHHCTGPVGPIPVPDVYAQCGGWVPRRLLEPVYSAGDCYAHTEVGTPILPLPPWEDVLGFL